MGIVLSELDYQIQLHGIYKAQAFLSPFIKRLGDKVLTNNALISNIASAYEEKKSFSGKSQNLTIEAIKEFGERLNVGVSASTWLNCINKVVKPKKDVSIRHDPVQMSVLLLHLVDYAHEMPNFLKIGYFVANPSFGSLLRKIANELETHNFEGVLAQVTQSSQSFGWKDVVPDLDGLPDPAGASLWDLIFGIRPPEDVTKFQQLQRNYLCYRLSSREDADTPQIVRSFLVIQSPGVSHRPNSQGVKGFFRFLNFYKNLTTQAERHAAGVLMQFTSDGIIGWGGGKNLHYSRSGKQSGLQSIDSGSIQFDSNKIFSFQSISFDPTRHNGEVLAGSVMTTNEDHRTIFSNIICLETSIQNSKDVGLGTINEDEFFDDFKFRSKFGISYTAKTGSEDHSKLMEPFENIKRAMKNKPVGEMGPIPENTFPSLRYTVN